ncbi:hypothetical protein [Castellaniella denitrificans]|uniref:hypothetical protein n=1 Tax=Castellaniella denitrificans TaxID=56119 RepID=UPI0036163CD3
MEEQEGWSSKVGAGETAACHQCGRPFALALGETSACQCPGGLAGRNNDKETVEWLARAMNEMRERDRAVLAGLHARTDAAAMKIWRRYRLRQVLVFVLGVVFGGALTAIYFMEILK